MEKLEPTVRLICSAAEILGAFFLAVEAMKLENFRVLQDRFVRPFYRSVNPTISFVDDPSPRPRRTWKRPLDAFELFLVSILTIGALFVTLGFFAADFRLDAIVQYLANSIPGPTFVGLVAAWIGILLGSLISSLLVGGTSYSLLVGLTVIAVRFLDAIERHTPTGAIGLLGFLLFFLGATTKAYLDWN